MTNKLPSFFRAGDVLLLVIAAFWGATYLVTKELGRNGHIESLLAIRFTIAAAALWIYAKFIRKDKFTKQEWLIGAAFGVTQTFTLNLEAQSVHYTSATNGGLIIGVSIITVPILESIWRKNWLPKSFFLATLIALIGLFLLVVGNGFVQPNIGDLFMFVAMVIRTFHFVILGRVTQGKPISMVNLTTITVSTSGVIMLLLNPVDAWNTALTYNTSDWLNMIFLSVLCTSFAFIGMNWAVQHTSASRASLLLGTEPIWSTLIAAVIAHEVLGPAGIIGAALIIGATYWGQIIEARHRLK
jgi:drug/metabolite transporter (DMT)-like permease